MHTSIFSFAHPLNLRFDELWHSYNVDIQLKNLELLALNPMFSVIQRRQTKEE